MAKRKLPGDRDTILSIAHQQHVTDEHNYPLVGSASRDRRIMLIFADFHFTLKNRGQSDLFTSPFWSKIKLDREFWAEVNLALGWNDYNDYKLVRKEKSEEVERKKKPEKELFGLTELTMILPGGMLRKFQQIAKIFVTQTMPKLTGAQADEEVQRQVKDDFMKYMLWYDEEATASFLQVFARYLVLTQQLVPVEATMHHGAGGGGVVSRREPGVMPEIKEEEEEPGVMPPPREPVKPIRHPRLAYEVDQTLTCLTTLTLLSSLSGHTQVLVCSQARPPSMQTNTNTNRRQTVPPFEIQLRRGGQVIQNVHVPVSTLIHNCVKFFYDGRVYLFLIDDNLQSSTLVHFHYNTPTKHTVVHSVALSHALRFLDVSIVDVNTPVHLQTFCTTEQCVNDYEALRPFCLSRLREMRYGQTTSMSTQDVKVLMNDQQKLVEVAEYKGLTEDEKTDLERHFRIVLSPGLKPQLTKEQFEWLHQKRMSTTGYLTADIIRFRKDVASGLRVSVEQRLTPLYGHEYAPFDAQANRLRDGLIRVLAARVVSLPVDVHVPNQNGFFIAVIGERYGRVSLGSDQYVTETQLSLQWCRFDSAQERGEPEQELLFPIRTKALLELRERIVDFKILYYEQQKKAVADSRTVFYLEIELEGGRILVTEETYACRLDFTSVNPPAVELLGELALLQPKELADERSLMMAQRKAGYKRVRFLSGEPQTRRYDYVFMRNMREGGGCNMVFVKITKSSAGSMPFITSDQTVVGNLSLGEVVRIDDLVLPPHTGDKTLVLTVLRNGQYEIRRLLPERMKRRDPDTITTTTGMQALSARFSQLGLVTPKCVYCGEGRPRRDEETGKHYCDQLCQRLFCRTNRLVWL